MPDIESSSGGIIRLSITELCRQRVRIGDSFSPGSKSAQVDHLRWFLWTGCRRGCCEKQQQRSKGLSASISFFSTPFHPLTINFFTWIPQG